MRLLEQDTALIFSLFIKDDQKHATAYISRHPRLQDQSIQAD